MKSVKSESHRLSRRFERAAASAIIIMFLVTALSGVGSSAAVVQKSNDLKFINPSFVERYDLKDVLKSALSGSVIDLSYLGPSGVAFRLAPSNIISPDCIVVQCGMKTSFWSDMYQHPFCFYGTDLVGAKSVTATFTSTWMHIQVELLDGKLYSIDPYDGTGDSGLYAVYVPTDYTGPTVSLTDPCAAPSQPYPEPNVGIVTTSNATSETGTIIDPISNQASSNLSSQNLNNPAPLTSLSGFANEYSKRLLRIFLAADYEYWNGHSDYLAKMVSRLNDINGRFENQLNVGFLVTSFCAIPYGTCTSTVLGTLLEQFRTYLNVTLNVPENMRDIAHLFSGKTFGSSICCYYQAGAGEDRWTGNNMYRGYECSLSQQSIYGDNNMNDWVLGYSIAHSLNGDVAYSGTLPDGYHSWLWSWWYPVGNIELTFTTNNANRIGSWATAIADKEKYVNYGTSSTTSDGIRASCIFQCNDYVCQVGMPANITFTLTNLATSSRTLTNIYVSGLDPGNNDTSDLFGKAGSYTLPANGGSATWNFAYVPMIAGTWTFWPDYSYSGHEGFPGGNGALLLHPMSWYNITGNMRYWQGLSASSYSTDLFYRWGLFTDAYNASVAGKVLGFCCEFNMNAGTSTDTYLSVFIQGRGMGGESDCKDFGVVLNPALTQKANSYVGGGCCVCSMTSLTQVGKYKFFPSFQRGSGQWGPQEWGGGKRLSVGYVWIPWSLFGTTFGNWLTMNTGLRVDLSTWDGSGAVASLTVGLANFENYGPGTGYPDAETLLQTAYFDKNPGGNPSAFNDNCLYHMKVVIEKVSSFNEGPWGTTLSASTQNSVISLRTADGINHWEDSCGCMYYSDFGQLNIPVLPAGVGATSLLMALAGVDPAISFTWGAAWFFYNTVRMFQVAPGDKLSENYFTDTNPAWADWYSCQNNLVHPVGKVNTTTYNYADLQSSQQSGLYIYRIHAEVNYAYQELWSQRLGQYIETVSSVETPYLYWIVG